MSFQARIDFVMKQGEDWAAQVICTDHYDRPLNITEPARMDIKDDTGQVVLALAPDTIEGESPIPGLGLSATSGVIQLYISKAQTAALPPGTYYYDLFAMVDQEDDLLGPQMTCQLEGTLTITKRITEIS